MAFLIEHPRELRTLNTQTRFGAGIGLLVAASMTLTACGGDSDSGADSKDKIKGAESSSTPPPATSTPSSTPMDDGIDRPEIKLPADVKNVFEDSKTGDPKKDAVLADSERRINSVDHAVLSGNPKSPALKFYSSGPALTSAIQYVNGFLQNNKSFTGESRYYQRKVTLLDDENAVVSYCMDTTEANSKDRKTGKVTKAPGGPIDYVFFNTRVKKNQTGVWQTNYVNSTEKAKRCM
ncbi:hypothetical protein [Streptomyces buecherae]|uniref:hypothetical protein n=1 Tax=Streptomyces buecherae TaxID=2763006 RepID=UPI0037ABB04B